MQQSEDNQRYILCIDDDPDDCNFIEDALKMKQYGVDVRYVQSGDEAINCMTHYIGSNDLPALITLDINMPGKDGIETFQVLKQLLGNIYIPIIFLSTSINNRAVSLLESQHVSVVQKPSSLAGYAEIADTIVERLTLTLPPGEPVSLHNSNPII